MDETSQSSINEQDVIDWVIFSGGATKGEIAKRTKIEMAALDRITDFYQAEKILTIRKRMFRSVVVLNDKTPEGVKEGERFLPHSELVGGKRRFKTNLDVINHLVDRFGTLELGMLSRFFKTSDEVVESWAKILHDQGILTLYYPLVGDPVLVRRGGRIHAINSALLRYLILIAMASSALLWWDKLKMLV
jgi:hypothetical protein